MTHMSMALDFPEGASRETLEKGVLSAATVRNLDGSARMCGPYQLRDWCKSRGIELYYVDNCWVRAVVTGRQVQEFFGDGNPELVKGIAPGKLYLLESEEL